MSLLDQAAELPAQPGVYLFYAPDGEVLYVGKARNLRARVRQYLGGHDERMMVPFLVRQAARVEVVLTANEKEALLLENTLIKRHTPRYNVKLRDDKNFLHLRIDPREPWPRFRLVRRIRADGARTFGPYASAQKARNTLAFLERAFPLRTCTDAVLASRRRPCLLHQMGRCVAPCVPGHTDEQAYARLVQQATWFLEGRDRELLADLQVRMRAAATEERFEEAARLRDLSRTVEQTLTRQKVVDGSLADRDVWGVFREGDRGVAAVVPVREGMMLEPLTLSFDETHEPEAGLLSTLLNTWYDDADRRPPPEILLPASPDHPEVLEDVLGERRGGRVHLRVPRRGEKVELLELARTNARDRFTRATSREERRQAGLEALAGLLGLDAPPHRIECFDNSTLQGANPVASQVVFVDGWPERSAYRTYKLRTVGPSPDDYASMAEVLERRFRRACDEGLFPDLLVVDGGKGQLGVARRVLAELGLTEQAVVGLVKPRSRLRGARNRGDRAEAPVDAPPVDRVVLPDGTELELPDHHPALNLLRHLRDESHRFAIGFHRRQRQKTTLGSALEELPGVGATRRNALLKHFGSARAVLAATEPELAAAPGFGPTLARRVFAALAERRAATLPEGTLPESTETG